MKKNQHFLIPMVVSIVLLPCLVGYFLMTEYLDEVAAVVLEEKDEVIDNFFARIDTVSSVSKYHQDGLATWLSLDTTPSRSFNIRVERNKDDHVHDGSMRTFIDSIGADTIVTLQSDVKGSADKVHFRDQSGGQVNADHLEIFRFENSQNKFQYGVNRREVPAMQILARILPQLLFSFILLLSVFIAYWLVHRSLKNERQLTLLRNGYSPRLS